MWEHTPTYLTTKRNRTMKNDNNETYREMEKRLNRNAWYGGAISLLLPVAFILSKESLFLGHGMYEFIM